MRLSSRVQKSLNGFGLSLISCLSAIELSALSAVAQSLPACLPPRENQFLLLVLNQQPNTQNQLRQLLPSNAILTACDYLSNSVVRVEGFSSADIATAWAKYVSDRSGLQTFVARSANSAIVTSPALPRPASAGGTSSTPPAQAYNPQPLGTGYAVLVNYFNQPELAANLRQVTTNRVGLAAYNQQPYLLALQTTDETTAAAMLKTLSDRGFTAVIVDSRRVMLLTPTVAGGS